MLTHGRLTGDQRLAVIRTVWTDKADRAPGQLYSEGLDVEIVLAGGTVPGMTERTRRAIEQAAKQFLEETRP